MLVSPIFGIQIATNRPLQKVLAQNRSFFLWRRPAAKRPFQIFGDRQTQMVVVLRRYHLHAQGHTVGAKSHRTLSDRNQRTVENRRVGVVERLEERLAPEWRHGRMRWKQEDRRIPLSPSSSWNWRVNFSRIRVIVLRFECEPTPNSFI